MIVSHRHRFVFLRTPETAATRVEVALSYHCGPEDVLTPLPTADELLRQDLGIHPRRYARWPLALLVGQRINWHKLRGRPGRGFDRRGLRRFTGDMPAARLRGALGPRLWDAYCTIGVLRDPLDRMADAFYTALSDGTCETVEAFLDGGGLSSALDHLGIEGRVAVDRILRHDHVQEDLAALCADLGLEHKGWLPKSTRMARPDQKDWRQLFTPAQVERIVRCCAADYAILAAHGQALPRQVEAILPQLSGA